MHTHIHTHHPPPVRIITEFGTRYRNHVDRAGVLCIPFRLDHVSVVPGTLLIGCCVMYVPVVVYHLSTYHCDQVRYGHPVVQNACLRGVVSSVLGL